MSTKDELDRIRRVYSSNYQPRSTETSYPWHPLNPISIYYRQTQERAIIHLLKKYSIPLEQIKILDAGCGIGGLLRFFTSLQAQPESLYGVDLMPERIRIAQQISPKLSHFLVGDIGYLPFSSKSFDLVCSFTVFSSILNDDVRHLVSCQIVEVLKPGGWLLWYDFHRGTSPTTRGVPLTEVDRLFGGLKRVALFSMHPYRAASVARRSLFLCEILDRIPLFPRTHWLALYQKY